MTAAAAIGATRPAGVPAQYKHVYVHVPFCSRRCTYCDFSIAVRRDVPAAAFAAEVAAELALRADPAALANVETLYFGGGTPSKLGGPGILELIGRLEDAGVVLAPSAEVTIEANPEDVSQGSAAAWLAAGVNRLSLGVQSYAPASLEWMHRTHSSAQAVDAFNAARDAGFGDISLDLIYALPERLKRDWPADLDQAVALGPDHLSVYGLTVEPRTPLGRWAARGSEVPQTDDRAADEFLAADAALTAAGYEHYEVSSYAKAGRRSRHNSAYWRRVPYLGLGPSAHSFDGAERRWNVAAYAAWESTVSSGADPIAGAERLDDTQHAAETLYLQLRTDAGAELTSPRGAALAGQWVAEGWAVQEHGRTRLTPEGWLRLDALAASLDHA